MTTHQTACILCSRSCGIEVEAHDGHLTKIRGDTKNPVSQGYICQKPTRLDYYQNNADRLTHPLRRRPDGTFERVTWDEALEDIGKRLLAIREKHGGKAFALCGGGGQANHLGGAFGLSLMLAMRSVYCYTSLAQELTGEFWVNGKLFGRQSCHIEADVERADFVLMIGKNPWQSHGIHNARDTLKDIQKSSTRKMAVIDPRRTETAKIADYHLQVRPGTDAFLLSAMLAILVRDNLVDREFLEKHTLGYDALEKILREVPISEYVARAGVALEDVERVTQEFAAAERACVRTDLGILHSLHSTLNSYLAWMLFILTGNMGKPGGNNFHSAFLPVIDHSGDGLFNVKTTATGTPAIARHYPPNVLPEEIDNNRPDRVRAVFVQSMNPLLSSADTQAFERAFRKLELLVVVDVAMTETARLAHYVLPAASQFEKWEASGFNMDFPRNGFHLRAPIFPPLGESLTEAEIYTRLLEKMGEVPRFPLLERVAKIDRQAPSRGLFPLALVSTLAVRPWLARYLVVIVYSTLGRALPEGAAETSFVWLLSHVYAVRYRQAVKRAGLTGTAIALGEAVFQKILGARSGAVLSEHLYEDTWSFVHHKDRKVHLEVSEMLSALQALRSAPTEPEVLRTFPFVLMAGERRSYNANTTLRDPAWRKVDPEGCLSIHPDDAEALGLADGDRAVCRSARGEVTVTVKRSANIPRGVLSLPHGYGIRYAGSEPMGPNVNVLTSSDHRDPIAATPYHKYVPVRLEKCSATLSK
ncbi:MAG: molybdopterin-dependent oxidoreductase [Myxococcales bacterium]